MKTVSIETHDCRNYGFDNVTEITDLGDFMVIKVNHPNGKKETHQVSTRAIQRMSYYDTTNVVVAEENVEK